MLGNTEIVQSKRGSPRRPLCSLTLLVIAVFLLSLLPQQQSMAGVLALGCSKTFPCTPEVRQRALFWVQVFSRWNNNQVILHDSAYPQRVYAVIRSKHGCGRSSTPRHVEKKRKKIRRQLLLLAAKGNTSRFASSSAGRRLQKLFSTPSRKQLRAAAGRIRCQQGNKDRFRKALQRFGRYRKMVERVMRNARLPVDLKYLPFVESAYNPAAYSRVGAAGLWQIMPRTARGLGLQIGVAVDERLDPEQATLAAARFFRNSKNRLLIQARQHRPGIKATELMPFIVTSYNYGINGMRRAVKKMGPDFGKVLANYRSSYFQTAVKNFYASFLAVRYIARHSKHYFPGVVADRPPGYTAVSLRRAASAKRLARVFSVSQVRLRKLNPALASTVWKNWQLIPAGYRLRLPPGIRGKKTKLKRLSRLPAETLVAIRYRVRRGDTVCGIAARFAVSCRRLLALNRLTRRSLIRSGQKLNVPSRRQLGAVRQVRNKKNLRLAKSAKTSRSKQPARMTEYYIVKRGDSVCRIAQRLPISCQQLLRINGLTKRSVLRPGKKLVTVTASVTGYYIVKRGDSVCRIAQRLPISCQQLLRINGLTKRSVLRPGKKLVTVTASVTGTVASKAKVQQRTVIQKGSAQAVAFRKLIKPPDAELDIQVHVRETRSGKTYRIRVQPEETLGHYADWLALGSTRTLKRRNHLNRKHSLRVGQWFQLPALGQPAIDSFEHQRAGFHALLVDEFRSNFRLQRVSRYRLKRGDSAWKLSQRFQVPWWLMTRMNPKLLEQSLQIGQIIRVPVIQAR